MDASLPAFTSQARRTRIETAVRRLTNQYLLDRDEPIAEHIMTELRDVTQSGSEAEEENATGQAAGSGTNIPEDPALQEDLDMSEAETDSLLPLLESCKYCARFKALC